jgi:hypothetical protein
MTIEYLKSYEEKKDQLDNAPVRSCTIEEIQEIRDLLNEGNPMPKAFEEFLFIGGKYTALPLDIDFRSIKGCSVYLKKEMAKRGVKIDRPIAVFHCLDLSFFVFIYLDEGDNPLPWNCSTSEDYDSDEGEKIWKSPFKTFKEDIDEMVELAVKGLGL